MNKKYTRFLAIGGTGLVWCAILAPLLLGIIVLVGAGNFRFDYLMPAELFPLVLLGGGMLVWAAIRVKALLRFIISSLVIGVASLLGAQFLAIITGLASGETATGGWQWVLVLLLLGGYDIAIVLVGVAGLVLIRNLFKPALN